MIKPNQTPGFPWRLMRRLNQRVVQNYRRGIGPGKVVLLLTTIGRKSGLPRRTPLQYEEYESVYYVASARGVKADWFCNVQANPRVEVQIHERCIQGLAEPIVDPERIADFLQLRLKRHPIFIGLLMRLEGLPLKYTRADLVRFAGRKALVAIRPDAGNN